MQARLLMIFGLLLLASCASPGGSGAKNTGDRCLYATEAQYGNQLRWGSCADPPPYSRRLD